MPFGRKSPLEALALPGVILAYKYSQFKQRRREAANRRVTERELTALHHKIEKLLSKLDESELEPPTSQEDECVICINARATMQTSPCGHRVVCRRCFVKTIQSAVAQRLLPLRCVICRTRINRLTSSSGTWRLQGSASSYSMASKSWSVPGSASSYSVNAVRVTQSASLYSMTSGSSCNSGVSNMSNMSNSTNCSGTSGASGMSSSSSNSGVHPSNHPNHTHNSSCSTNGCLGAIPRNPSYQNSYYYKKSGQYSFKHRAPDMPNRLPPIKEFPVNSPVKRTTSPVNNPGARYKSYTASSIKSASSIEKTPLLDDYNSIQPIISTPITTSSSIKSGPSKIGLNAKIAPTYSKSPINRTNMATGKPITTPIVSATTSRVISAAALSNNSFSKYDEKFDNKRNETLERKKRDEKAKVKAEKEAKKEEKRLAKEEEKLAKQLAKEEKKRGKKDAKEREALLSADQRCK